MMETLEDSSGRSGVKRESVLRREKNGGKRKRRSFDS
jgi:hypothetical protein